MSHDLKTQSETDQTVIRGYERFERGLHALVRGEPLPAEPAAPIPHMLLGREPLPAPAAATNAIQPAKKASPLTADQLRRLLDELPEPEMVIFHKPSGVGMSERQFRDFFFGTPVVIPMDEPDEIEIGITVSLKRR